MHEGYETTSTLLPREQCHELQGYHSDNQGFPKKLSGVVFLFILANLKPFYM